MLCSGYHTGTRVSGKIQTSRYKAELRGEHIMKLDVLLLIDLDLTNQIVCNTTIKEKNLSLETLCLILKEHIYRAAEKLYPIDRSKPFITEENLNNLKEKSYASLMELIKQKGLKFEIKKSLD